MKYLLTIFLSSLALATLPQRFSNKEIIEFYKHIESQGVKLMNYSEKGLGIQVEKDFNVGDAVLCTKKQNKLASNDDFVLSKYISHLDDIAKLKVRILYLKFMSNESDYFTNYVKTLSNSYFHYGLFNQEHISLLLNLTLLDFDYEDPRDDKEYSDIKLALKDVEGVPDEMLKYESFMWAHFVVRSRNYAYYVNDTRINVIIPVLDVANHYQYPLKHKNSWFFNNTETDDCLVTFWPLQKGDEFVYQYAIHSSLTFLMGYDLIMFNSPYDFVVYEYNGPVGFGNPDDKYFRFHADSLNFRFFNTLSIISGSSFKFQDSVRETFDGLNPSEHFNMIDNLFLYRIFVNRYINSWPIGLRLLRRSIKAFDYISSRIILYGISTRITAYNHLRVLDQDILYILHAKAFKTV